MEPTQRNKYEIKEDKVVEDDAKAHPLFVSFAFIAYIINFCFFPPSVYFFYFFAPSRQL